MFFLVRADAEVEDANQVQSTIYSAGLEKYHNKIYERRKVLSGIPSHREYGAFENIPIQPARA